MEAYSKEFRRDVLAACDAGECTHDVALRFRVSKSWVRRIKQQRRETGQVAAKTMRKRTAMWQAWADWLLAQLDARPDIYLREWQSALLAERGAKVSLQTIYKRLPGVGTHAKKRR